MNSTIPDISVPIIKDGITSVYSIKNEFKSKKIILFGLPGAFTPTCSDKHLPDFINSSNLFKKKGFENIYCLSVNDEHVMKAWLLSHSNSESIYGIADGNAEITKYFNLLVDKSKNYMGLRSSRFAMIINNNEIKKIFIDKSGDYEISSPSHILKNVNE